MPLVTPLYVAIAAFAIIGLFVNVVRNRFKYQTSLGDGGHQGLIRARSVHGNFIEVVPFVLFLMFMIETQGYGIYVIHAFGIALIISRICHGFGIYHKTTAGKLRIVGSLTALLLMLVGAVLILLTYI